MRKSFALLALVALSGCLSFGEDPPPFLLTLTPDAQREAGDTRSAATGQAVTITTPEVPQRLATSRLAVTTGPTTIVYFPDALWSDTPNELFRELLSEVVAARSGRIVLDPRQFTSDPGTIVTGQLHEFGYDSRSREAVIVYDAAITGDGGVRTRRFEAREQVLAEDAQTLSQALNRAANRLAEEFSGWVTG
jgi:cholesterol transport system auxiliary component